MRWEFRTELQAEPLPAGTREAFITEMLDFLHQAWHSGLWGIWVADQDGEIVSHVYIERIRKIPRPTRFHAEYGYLTNMYTLPAWRGQGIGAELLRHAVEWGRAENFEMIILWPAKGRQGFYQRGGFIAEPEAMSQEL
jgi:GNAT superfamily N-acetyltransferase